MALVVDASVTMAWTFDDEDQPLARHALESTLREEVLVPWIWWFEVRNALLTSERDGRGSEARTAAVLRHLAGIPVSIDPSPDQMAAFHLCRRHRLTLYDAAYLELAARTGAMLATLDRKLLKAARAESVHILEAPS